MNVTKASNIMTPRPSGPWMQQLRTSMAAFAGSGHPLSDCLCDENWPGRQAVHCIYSVGFRHLKDLKDLSGVEKPLAWRFIAGGHKKMKTAAACWSTHESGGPAAKVLCALQAPEMAEILANAELLNNLSELSDHSSQQYELRVLRIPALYLEAFWLKSQSTQAPDWIIPYGLVPDGSDSIKLGAGIRLIKNKAYKVSDFLEVIRNAAHQKSTRSKAALTRRMRDGISKAKQASSH